MEPFTQGALFLVQSLFDMYIFILMLRVILQWVHADARNPLMQFIAKITNPPLKITRKIMPHFRGVDLAAITLLILLELLKFIFIILLSAGVFPAIHGLIVLSFAELFNQMISIFFYSIFIFIILSWFVPLSRAPFMHLLFQLTEPLLRPARRFIPPVGGLDLSPIPALIFLKLIQIVITQPLLGIGYHLAVKTLLGK